MSNKLRVNHTSVILRFFFALLFSLLFISAPWNQLVLKTNGDVEQYLMRIGNLLAGTDTDVDSMGLITYLFSEPVWRYILILIGETFNKPIDGLILVSFCVIFIYAFFLCGRVNLFLASFFLFNPMINDLVMAQVRSALAMALFLVALMINNKLIRLLVIAIASMIHTLTFVFFLVYIVANFIEFKRDCYNYKKSGIAALFFGIVLASFMGGGKAFLLSVTGDRRFAPDYDVVPISFLYLSYWMLLALVIALPSIQRFDNGFKDYWTSYYSIIMLTLPFVMGLFGGNSVRFVALCFPILLYSMTLHKTPVKASLIGSMFVYQIIQYLYWVRNF
ncbi:MAG: hypothetical protein PHG00_14825 [Methylococcales bacterium]|nr:hypothetical protein [Methylococcales bacterium]